MFIAGLITYWSIHLNTLYYVSMNDNDFFTHMRVTKKEYAELESILQNSPTNNYASNHASRENVRFTDALIMTNLCLSCKTTFREVDCNLAIVLEHSMEFLQNPECHQYSHKPGHQVVNRH